MLEDQFKEIAEKLDEIQRRLPAFLEYKQKKKEEKREQEEKEQKLYQDVDVERAKSLALNLPRTTEGNVAFLKLIDQLEKSGKLKDADYGFFFDEYKKRFESHPSYSSTPERKIEGPEGKTIFYERPVEEVKEKNQQTQKEKSKSKGFLIATAIGALGALGILLYNYKSSLRDDTGKLESRIESKLDKLEEDYSKFSTKLSSIESTVTQLNEKVESLLTSKAEQEQKPASLEPAGYRQSRDKIDYILEEIRTTTTRRAIPIAETDISISGCSCTPEQLQAYLEDNASSDIKEKSFLLHIWYGTHSNINPAFTTALMAVRSNLGKRPDSRKYKNLFGLLRGDKPKRYESYEKSIEDFYELINDSRDRNLGSIGILKEEEKAAVKVIMKEIQSYDSVTASKKRGRNSLDF